MQSKTKLIFNLSLPGLLGVVLYSVSAKLSPVFAQLEPITNKAIGNLGKDPDKAASGQLALEQFVRYWGNAITVGAIITILYFLWGGFEWLTSEGDSGKLEKARKKMMHAIIGLLILVSAFIVLGFISRLLFGDDFDILNLTFIFPDGES